ncbi:MAG: hypothetical protein KDE34_24660 [Anaerolineales bacterium]|nr:hypothetical protein [Anaerolineales bacterium]
MSQTVTLKNNMIKSNELPFLVRALWFVVIGLEATFVWILVAWALNLTVIGLPLGLWMIDRVPQVLTLKSRTGGYMVDWETGRTRFVRARQMPFIIRLAYFLLIGWWASLVWALLAYLFCVSIVGLPLGYLMLTSLPFVTTLSHN